MEHFYWNKIKFYHTHAQHFKVKSTIIVPPQYRVTSCYYSPSNWWFDGSVIDICVELFLSNAAAARLPAQQPKTRSTYAAHGCYAVLGSIYYGEIHAIMKIYQFNGNSILLKLESRKNKKVANSRIQTPHPPQSNLQLREHSYW